MEPELDLFLTEHDIVNIYESKMFLVLRPKQMEGTMTLVQAIKFADQNGMLSFLQEKNLCLISVDVISNHWVFKKV